MQNNCITNFIKTVQHFTTTIHSWPKLRAKQYSLKNWKAISWFNFCCLSQSSHLHTHILSVPYFSFSPSPVWVTSSHSACLLCFHVFFPESFSLMLCPVSEHFNVPDFKQMYISLKCVYIVHMVQSTCMFRVIFYVVLIQCSDNRTYNQLLTARHNNPMNLSHSLVKFWGASEARKYVKCKSDKEINHCCVCFIKATHCDTMNYNYRKGLSHL